MRAIRVGHGRESIPWVLRPSAQSMKAPDSVKQGPLRVGDRQPGVCVASLLQTAPARQVATGQLRTRGFNGVPAQPGWKRRYWACARATVSSSAPASGAADHMPLAVFSKRASETSRPYSWTGCGLPHRPGRAQFTALAGMRHPLVLRSWMRSGMLTSIRVTLVGSNTQVRGRGIHLLNQGLLRRGTVAGCTNSSLSAPR